MLQKNKAIILYFDADRGEEPAALLGDEVRVHATAVISSVQEVIDIQSFYHYFIYL